MIIGIIGKKDKKEVYEISKNLNKWFKEKGIDVYVEKELAAKIGATNSLSEDDIPHHVDLILALGGDGTFLGVSRLVYGYDIPILGINLGGLGFLTEITVDELFPMMERILSGDYEVEDREMLAINIFRDGKKLDDEYIALNELVINNGPISRAIELALYIDKSHITTFLADGMIFSTPTGSTAYSLSAGGPIVFPTLPVILITPICPHILTNRPLVVSSKREIRMKVLSENQNTYLTFDGQIGVDLDTKDDVVIKKSSSSVKLIKSPFRDYFSILKTKLMWGERYGKIN